MANKLINWIDFDDIRKTYTKTLPQPVSPDEFVDEFKFYLSSNKKYNIYGLASHFKMSKDRFTKYYLKSEDPILKEMSQWAIGIITSHAMANEEDYSRTLRYIISQAETGKSFIELDDAVQQANANKVIILPPKV